MKKLFYLATLLVAVLTLSACGKSKKVADGVVDTDVAIQTEIAGLTLGETYTKKQVENAVEKYAKTYFTSRSEKEGTGTHLILWPYSNMFDFAGYNWTYMDVYLTSEGKLAAVDVVVSVESYDPATAVYASLKETLSAKYGTAEEASNEGNAQNKYCAWHYQDKYGLSLSVEESSTVAGADRSFCTLGYYDLELFRSLSEEGKSEL